MSLIDEALKRAQQAHDNEAETARRRPWTPAPLPDRGRGNRLRLLAGAAVAIAVLALTAAGLVLLRRSPGTERPLPASPSARPTPIPPTPLPLEEVLVPPPSRGIAVTRPPSREREPPVAPAAAPAQPQAQTREPPAAPAPARAGERPGGLVSGKTYLGSVALPGGGRLELGGIAYSETNATALVNGRIVAAGDSIEGFTVVRVEENRVELSGNALTFFLALR